MMSDTNWGIASFGKRDGFEVFELQGVLHEIGQGNEKEALYQVLQLKLEEIRIFKDSQIFRLGQFEGKQGTVQLYSLFEYALDQYQRDGYRAVCFASKFNLPHSVAVWKALKAYMGTGDFSSETLQEGTYTHAPTDLYPNHAAFLPLYTQKLEEVGELTKAWQLGEMQTFRTIYASSSPHVRRSVQERNMFVFEGNPLWEAPVVEESHKQQTHLHPTKKRKENETDIPPDSLIYAFEGDADNRWEKKPKQEKRTAVKKETRIWGLLALAFLGILSSLLWITL